MRNDENIVRKDREKWILNSLSLINFVGAQTVLLVYSLANLVVSVLHFRQLQLFELGRIINIAFCIYAIYL